MVFAPYITLYLIIVGLTAGIGFVSGFIVYKIMKRLEYGIITGCIAGGVFVFVVLYFSCPGPFCNSRPTRNYVTGFTFFEINDISFSGESLSMSIKSNLNESLVIESTEFIGLSACYGKKETNEDMEYEESLEVNINGNERCKNAYSKGDVFRLDFIIKYNDKNKLPKAESGILNGIIS